ncbi:mannan endo-1,4-beta-mannosidase 2-like [Rhodamnia argentea]|uniref:mannan endo-1,4-beta-mannosidase n=1 Tax=Rhodamnia argentea TaxID=178133 RepID=A0A8B8QI98_9MYRT|nr:mannan endo-1,4-beta-mannosidase 2-like [Rhodamnia argentea]
MTSRTVARSGLFYPFVGFASCAAFLYLSFGDFRLNFYVGKKMDFVARNGTQFVVDGKVFYVNGWNSYWLMDQAVDEYSRPRVRTMLRAGARMGLTVCRTWAFNDNTYHALQIAPGQFDERVFQALDHVIAEANQHGIRLLLSLVNNLEAFGGKTQYVKWAWEEGIGSSSSNDSFFYDPSIRQYYKNFVKTVLTRKNTISGIEYRDDPTIFGWELMNEPRCMTDPAGDTLQDWLAEMSVYVRSIDKKHLLTVGLEGFYGPKSPKSLTVNPADWAALYGSDFVRNSNLPNIDFASAHIYPDHWFHELQFEESIKFVSKWVRSHIEDGDRELKRPVMFTEFGYSKQNPNFHSSQRNQFFKTIFDEIYESARKNGAGAGSFVWQFLVGGMEEYNDDFGIVPWQRSSTYELITEHSCRLAALRGWNQLKGSLRELCL